jgi:hypothetical protein
MARLVVERWSKWAEKVPFDESLLNWAIPRPNYALNRGQETFRSVGTCPQKYSGDRPDEEDESSYWSSYRIPCAGLAINSREIWKVGNRNHLLNFLPFVTSSSRPEGYGVTPVMDQHIAAGTSVAECCAPRISTPAPPKRPIFSTRCTW